MRETSRATGPGESWRGLERPDDVIEAPHRLAGQVSRMPDGARCFRITKAVTQGRDAAQRAQEA
jgi:hypothetical protein